MSFDMADVARVLRGVGREEMARFVLHVASRSRDSWLEVQRLRARIDELCPPTPVVVEERVRYTPPPEASD